MTTRSSEDRLQESGSRSQEICEIESFQDRRQFLEPGSWNLMPAKRA